MPGPADEVLTAPLLPRSPVRRDTAPSAVPRFRYRAALLGLLAVADQENDLGRRSLHRRRIRHVPPHRCRRRPTSRSQPLAAVVERRLGLGQYSAALRASTPAARRQDRRIRAAWLPSGSRVGRDGRRDKCVGLSPWPEAHGTAIDFDALINAKQGNAKQGNAKQVNAKQGNAKQGNAKQGNAKHREVVAVCGSARVALRPGDAAKAD